MNRRQELELERNTSFVMQRKCRWRPGMVRYLKLAQSVAKEAAREAALPPGTVLFWWSDVARMATQ